MAKKLAVIFGIIFILVAILGFIPNGIVSKSADATFQVDNMHNIVHLIVGIVLLLAGMMGESAASLWLKIFGVIYILLFIDGLFQVKMTGDKLLSFITANPADNWLHLVLGILLLIVGFAGGKKSMMMDKSTM
jgi:threonine/homoserine/homoserine lactone efflux protein